MLEIAEFAGGLAMIAQRRAAGLDGLVQHRMDRRHQPPGMIGRFGGFLRGPFAAGFLADVLEAAGTAFLAGVLGDFLRVFLDIRLPFVAFGGSIMGILRVLFWQNGFEPTAGQI